MSNKSKHPQKNRWLLPLIVTAVIALLALSYALMTKKSSNYAQLTCKSSAYQSVRNGLSQAEVTALLGEPASKRVKDSPEQNLFAQGENEANISEGWIYPFKDWTSAGVYFDSAGRVSGKGCGQG